MASFKETVEILFLATDQTDKGIQGVGQNLEDLSKPVADVTKKFLLFEAAVVAVGAAFATKAFNESVKFESALLDLQKVLGDGEGAASDYTTQVDALSSKFGISSTVILDGASNIKQAGFTVAESFSLQETALTAAVISELEAVEASDLLVRSLKGFKAPVEDANRILDIFNEVSNKNATNVRELGLGFSEIAPIAGRLGLTFEETAALLTPVIEVFGSGAEAGNALKIALTSLIVPTGPAADELTRLGVAVRNSDGSLRKGRDTVFDLIDALDKLEPTQQVATLSIIAGERQAARLSEALGNLAKTNKVLKDATDSNGSAQKEFNVRIQASEKQIDRARESFNNLARAIGDRFRVQLTGSITGLTALQDAFKELVEGGGLDPFIKAITPQLENIEKVLKQVAKALPEAWKDVDFSPIVKSLEDVFEGTSGLFDNIDLSKPEDLAKTLNELIKVISGFIDATAGIAQVFGTVGGVLVDIIQAFGRLDSGTQKLIGTIGGAAVVLNSFAPILTGVGKAVGALIGLSGFGGLTKGVAESSEAMSKAAKNFSKLETPVKALTSSTGLPLLGDSTAKFSNSATKASKSASNLAPKLSKLGKVSAILASPVGIVGVAVAIGAMAFALVKGAAKFGEFISEVEAGKRRLAGLPDVIETASIAFKRLGFESLDAFKAALKAGEVFFDAASGQWKKNTEKIKENIEKAKKAVDDLEKKVIASVEAQKGGQDEVIKAYNKTTEVLAELGDGYVQRGNEIVKANSEITESQISAREALDGNIKSVLELGNAYDAGAGTITVFKSATKSNIEADKEAAAALNDRVKELVEFRLGVEEIQSKERIAVFEFQTKIDLAQIESATRTFESLTDTIQVGIESTGSSIVELFKLLAEGSAAGIGLDLRDAIEREQELRERQFKLQEEITRAWIELAEARIRSMERGDAAIVVKAEGLEPHLQEVLRAIIEQAQFEGNANAEEFLFNIPLPGSP